VDECEGLTPQERAARVVFWLCAKHEALTTKEIAERIGISPRGTRKLLCRLSRVVPIHQYEKHWHGFVFN
jgi:predicted ArsR family transcriptional regulator